GGAVVLWVHYGTWHYVTLTGACGGSVELFDPYYRKQSFKQKGIELVKDKPFTANRSVPFSYLDSTGKTIYALGPVKDRAAVILYNTTTRKTAEQTIEYFL
ncbi:MAG: peptidase C39, partial [Oscillospiraceae bacterium]|nr:peptidase C39 [Oscillospiraceae bacterium]